MKSRLIAALLLAFVAGTPLASDLQNAPAADEERLSFPTKALRDAHAMYRRALRYETGTAEVKADSAKMLMWLERASRRGSGRATYKLYTYYVADPTGYANAAKYWSLAQQQGYCGPLVISNVRGPKSEYVVQPQCAGSTN